ncbi:phospholipase D-like domain-containing protein [Lawsonibacter sp. OA9]|uniref:phospholipase D-like domain-containing protein n=1 Tax=Oscillospiraceae TaxID=216572 RepID=UPI001F06632E|nr:MULTISPECIES: phospholipase D-like domain-containing protein [Oscillospiraceae]MCH1980925.1 phospholipase D-like domain-containing protein [Lawsonibacter sp. OA9]MCH1984217.1 phospholipase D-like domain-containing protein [Ruminococcus sp. OA3]
MKYKRMMTVVLIILVLIVYISFVCVPYRKQEGVTAKTKNSFDSSDFYGDHLCQDRAAILFQNDEALEERIRLISNASESIILSTFDFKSDNSGKIMLSALYDAAMRGVKVQLLLDGFSYFIHVMGDPYFKALGTLKNVTIKVYNPINILKPTKLMARMHDKYLIADDTAFILGGRNTFDYFLGNDTDYKNYDWDVLIYNAGKTQGSSVEQVKTYFKSVWELSECKIVMDSVPAFSKEKIRESGNELVELYGNMRSEHGGWFEEADYMEMTTETNQIRLISNPIQAAVKEPVLFYNMTELMMQSSEKIVFHTPYILCNDYMTERLTELGNTNEDVWMMTNSAPNNGNPFGAVDYLIHKEEIVDTGINIMEYDAGVSYHGKCFTIGDRLTGIGSFNWDMRSAYIDTELMLVVDSTSLNTSMRKYMKTYEEDTLIVQDEVTYTLAPGQIPQKISPKRLEKIRMLWPLDEWFRHLM